jgi:Protein of unknown function (DUF3575)
MRFFRLLFLSLIMLFCIKLSYAQPKTNDFYLRTNLLSLFEPTSGGITLGAEYFVSSHVSIGCDVGAILYRVGTTTENNVDIYGNTTGYKIKPELRYYLYKENKPKRARLFFGLEGLFLKSTTVNYRNLPVRDNTGNIVYDYIGGYNEIKKVKGAVIKAGVQIPRFILKKMFIEFYAGVGLRSKRYTFNNLPDGASLDDLGNDRLFLNTDIDGEYPSISAGFKLVYKIW